MTTPQYDNIDETFPKPNRDNNSDGFRQNFRFIKESFIELSASLVDLQTSLIKFNTDNEGNNIQNVSIMGSIKELTNTGDDLNIDYSSASYYKINSSAAINSNIIFTGAIVDLYCKTSVLVHNTSIGDITIYCPATILSYTGQTITVASNSKLCFDCWTVDGGVINYINILGTA